MTNNIEWDAQQVCGECGEGVFSALADYGFGPSCTVCEHVHAMDKSQLGESEEFYFAADNTLHVRAYAVVGE